MNDMSQHIPIPNEMDIFFKGLKNKGPEHSAQVLSMANLLGQSRGNASSVIWNTKTRSDSVLKKAA